MIQVNIQTPWTLPELLAKDDGTVVEVALDAWERFGDYLEASDILDRCAEDTRSDLARARLGEWFDYIFLADVVTDPEEVFADGFNEATEKRLADIADLFADAVFEGIIEAHDYAATLRSLPR